MPQADNANLPRERRYRSDNPNQIADHLTEQHGAEGALKVASQGIADAQRDHDNYRLSIWRETRRILRNRAAAALNDADC